jgi:hypothetical protein
MRLRATVLVVAGLFLVSWFGAEGATLEDRKNEWSFALNAVDTDDVGTSKEFFFDWAWTFERGYHQLGVSVSAFDIDFDDPWEGDVNGFVLGPVYQWNWTPSKEWGTGFLFAGYGIVGGDLGDLYENEIDVGVGIKVFAGNSAAIRVLYALSQLQGEDWVEDQDSARLVVGISLYSHSR